MITNLVATIIVALSTNVTERFSTHEEGYYPVPPGTFYAIWGTKQVPDVNPTKKWVRTTVSETTSLQFDFAGQHYSQVISNRTVKDMECEYRLTQGWEPETTNDLSTLWLYAAATNYLISTNLYIYALTNTFLNLSYSTNIDPYLSNAVRIVLEELKKPDTNNFYGDPRITDR